MRCTGKFAWAIGGTILLILSPAAPGQQDTAQSDFVPRQEYEQLRRELDEMRQRLDMLERAQHSRVDSRPQPGETATAPTEAAPLPPQAAHQETGEWRFEVTSRAQPNWVRPDGWMEPNFRTSEMDLYIGRGDGVEVAIGLQTVGRLQWLEQNDVFISGVEQRDLDPGFQTAWGDLAFLADIDGGKMQVFFDLYISSRPHPSTTYGNEGYILIRELPDQFMASKWLNDTVFSLMNVKVGHFEIDYGDHRYRRSDNAWVQRNPLIGNYIIDPDVEEIGMELYSKPQWLNWLVGISSGTTTENLNEGRGIASVHGKLWTMLNDDLRASISGYYVDHSDNPASGPGSTKGNLFSGRRSGDPYGAVLAGGNAPGQVLPGKDQLVTAVQADLTWTPDPWEFYGHIGWMRDADPNGSLPSSPEESWTYGTIESVYYFNPRVYAAARYGVALANQIAGASADGMVHRFQLGGGYWVTKNMLAKVEGVYQAYQDFSLADGLVSGVDAAREPSFFGVIFEVSFAF